MFTDEPGHIVARHVEDGSLAWQFALDAPLAARLVCENGRLIAAAQSGEILALHAADGTLIWREELGSPVHAPPSLAGDRVYIPLSDNRVVALKADTGARLWERRLGGPPNEVLGLDDRLYVGSNDNYLYCLKTGDGIVDWRWRTGADVVGLPVADDHRVYFVSLDNVLRSLDRKSGAQRWKRALPVRPTRGPVRVVDVVLVSGVAPASPAFAMKDGTPAGEVVGAGELAAAPYPVEIGALPAVILVSRDIAKGTVVAAVGRAIDPPTSPVGPLPNLIAPPKPPTAPTP
jgi:outer membrane protein assembly factor BamB